MGLLITLLLLTIICWIVFVKIAKAEPTPLAFFLLLLGSSGIMGVIGVAHNYKNGLPITEELKQGIYKVGFVYRAGDNISIGIERKKYENEKLYFYMFPRKNFEGAINPNGKKLRVLDDGSGYHKLRLEPNWP